MHRVTTPIAAVKATSQPHQAKQNAEYVSK
jgi:hypothetical protein